MPPLFTSGEKIKIIEYGQHANDDISFEGIKSILGKIIKFKAAA
jgi:hypothetical protein